MYVTIPSQAAARRWIGRGLLVVSLSWAFASVVGLHSSWASSAEQPSRLWSEGTALSPAAEVPNGPSFAKIAKAFIPAVVNISTTKKRGRSSSLEQQEKFKGFFEKFFGGPYAHSNSSLGSGFVINRAGYILTNSHVIEGTEDSVWVTLLDKREYRATVVGRDEKTDIALIKIDPPEDLPIIPLGDSERLEIGDWVLAIGNPYGYSHSVTAGIVSAKGREIGAGPYDNFIQTDASINPGNSGGPLLNTRGEVVGISTAIVSPGQGIGFAIPINMAKALVPQLVAHGRVARGWLGINIQEVDHKTARAFGLSEPGGALVTNVLEGNSAFEAGIQEGDVIVAFNHRAVDGVRSLQRAVATLSAGSEVELDVLRDGKRKTFQLVIGERGSEKYSVEREIQAGFGLRLEEITEALRERYNAPATTSGIVITRVEHDSVASKAGVERGDVILEVNRQSVKTLRDYLRLMRDHGHSGGSILLLVQRADRTIYIALKGGG
ncbi:MAG: Do family serine endopeptidase [bacterium]|nr:Do family serine endopeptidase [bacterium]